jgi:hypothetical protein
MTHVDPIILPCPVCKAPPRECCECLESDASYIDALRIQLADLNADLGRFQSAIATLHSLVDQTDPSCPIGMALTKAGLVKL